MTDLRRQYLAAMEIPVWVPRDSEDEAQEAPAPVLRAADAALPRPGRSRGPSSPDAARNNAAATVPALSDASGADAIAAEAATADWETLQGLIRNCTRCELHRTRQQAVVGVGNRKARLLVIGEAPGQEEDRQGEPFVGRAGQLLTAMLRAIGLERDAVYIANVLKCRPPNNRDPRPDESSTCAPFLDRQLALIEPRAILVLGRIAAQRLLQSDAPVGRLRGKETVLPGRGIPLIVSYHPAYLLRSPAAKAKAWHDLCLVRNLLGDGA